MRTTKIADNIMSILQDATVLGNNVVLNSGQLDSKTYKDVNKVLMELGGKWNTKAKAHIFPTDPKEIFDSLLDKGELSFAKDNGYFPTPRELAEVLVDWAEIDNSHLVLEPSAGTGNLAEIISERYSDAVVNCFEINPKFVEALRNKEQTSTFKWDIHNRDFLSINFDGEYDRVVMNPPFDKGQTEIDHVMHAWDALNQDGILVAILPTGVVDRTNKKSKNFQEFLSSCGAEIVRNDQGSFKSSGTMVNTIRIKVVNT